MKKNIIFFLIFLILPNFSLACDKEDFLKFVSAGKKKCIALQTIGKIERNKKNFSGVLGISIGKGKEISNERAHEDYLHLLDYCFLLVRL